MKKLIWINGGVKNINKMADNISMRDAFWNRIYDIAQKDKDVILIAGDMGAPSLDKFRENLSDQYINIGIAEHNMIGVGAGLAKEGKKVFTYAIAPFITSRCHEFTKIEGGLMKIPINLVGVGAGFGYEDSGPTHHTTEDISIMRTLPNLEIYGPSDSNIAAACAEMAYNSPNPTYIRLDREVLPNIHKSFNSIHYQQGFKTIYFAEDGLIISTGNMVHKALEISDNLKQKGLNIAVMDLYKLNPIDEKALGKEISAFNNKIISLEEHLLAGGLGSILAETIVDENIDVKLKRIGLKDYIYAYGGRENVRKEAGIGTEEITKQIYSFFR